MEREVIPYKDRVLDSSKEVKVYRCLNRKGKWYSIQQNGLVVAHTTDIKLNNVKFVVNIKGKERAIKECVRNVHAFIVGNITNNNNNDLIKKVSYYPFCDDMFYTIVDGERVNIHKSDVCHINKNGVFVG